VKDPIDTINPLYTSKIIYKDNDNNIIFSINEEIYNKYKDYGYLLNDERSNIVSNLFVNEIRRNNLNNLYLEELLQLYVKKYNGEWNDKNTIRSSEKLDIVEEEYPFIKEILNEIVEKIVNPINISYDNEVYEEGKVFEINEKLRILEKQLYNQYINDESYYELISSTNEYNDKKYNNTDVLDISFLTSYYTYYDNETFSFEEFNDKSLRLYLNVDSIVDNLIVFNYKSNHIKKNNDISYDCIKYILGEIFNSHKIIDYEQFKVNPLECIINGRKLIELEKEINDIYEYFSINYNYKKKTIARRDSKVVSKLEFILYTMFKLNIREYKPDDESVRKSYLDDNKKRIRYIDYCIYIDTKLKDFNDLKKVIEQDITDEQLVNKILRYFKEFSYNERVKNSPSSIRDTRIPIVDSDSEYEWDSD
jgi:hypothetical protein